MQSMEGDWVGIYGLFAVLKASRELDRMSGSSPSLEPKMSKCVLCSVPHPVAEALFLLCAQERWKQQISILGGKELLIMSKISINVLCRFMAQTKSLFSHHPRRCCFPTQSLLFVSGTFPTNPCPF